MTTIKDLGEFTQGEIPMPLLYTFLDAAAAPIDLLNFTAKFVYGEERGTPVTATTAAVTNHAAGEVTYTWSGAEFATPGHWSADLWVGNGTQRYCSDRLTWTVRAAIGTVPTI